jgi:hypothetical protein
LRAIWVMVAIRSTLGNRPRVDPCRIADSRNDSLYLAKPMSPRGFDPTLDAWLPHTEGPAGPIANELAI